MLAFSKIEQDRFRIAITLRLALEYKPRVPEMYNAVPNGAPGQRRHASEIGIADLTPYTRAA